MGNKSQKVKNHYNVKYNSLIEEYVKLAEQYSELSEENYDSVYNIIKEGHCLVDYKNLKIKYKKLNNLYENLVKKINISNQTYINKSSEKHVKKK